MTTVTVSGFKIRKGERLYGTYVRYALYKATPMVKKVNQPKLRDQQELKNDERQNSQK